MDFGFSEDQKMIQASIRDFLDKECPSDKVRELEATEKGYDPEIWHKMADLGYLGIHLPEDYQGTGGDFLDLMILMEEMGRKLLPSPFFSTIALCSLPLLVYGNAEHKKRFLPDIASGRKIWTLAFTELFDPRKASEIKLHGRLEKESFLLSGTKLFVPYAHVADYLLVVARTDGKDEEGITLFIVDGHSPGLRLEMIPTTAHDKQYEVHFDNARIPKTELLGKEGEGWSILNFILQRGTVLKCAEMLGGAQGALDITTDYAKKRTQFNRPIGAFQAIQHKLADLLIDVEGLRYLVYQAAWGINIGSPSPLLISMAKARANEVYERTCIEGIKTHGALGFTREQDIGLYHIRTKASEFTLGNSDFHKEKIAEELDRYQPPQL
jgi:alkylation response protein AidB-like acyl-CoA dehydrogenase